jgi:undecaprenyl-diphosphatase
MHLVPNDQSTFEWGRIDSLRRLGLLELWFLGSVTAVAGLLYAFSEISEEVIEGDTLPFDQAVLRMLRSPHNLADPIGPGWLEEAARDITSLGSYAILGFVFFAVVAYLLIVKKRFAALWVIASILGGLVLSNALKFSIGRPRPDLVLHATRVFTPGFPSGHAMLAAVTYLTLGALLASLHTSRSLRVYFLGLALVLTILVGISRIYLGVHYPTDVLAGWCIGAAWAMLCWTVARSLQQRGTLEAPAGVSDASGEASDCTNDYDHRTYAGDEKTENNEGEACSLINR